MNPAPNQLSIALKEWNLLINALLAGHQAILLRKGGILESDNQFELEHHRFLLYPTFIHQDPRMVKPEHRHEIQKLPAEPENIEIKGYAEVAEILEVPNRPALESLSDLHLWDTPLIDMRFAYRPEKPLYLVIVRAFILPAPIIIPHTLEHAGCKSWVPLGHEIDITNSRPAMNPATLDAILTRVRTAFTPR
jgi:hypothetical protein